MKNINNSSIIYVLVFTVSLVICCENRKIFTKSKYKLEKINAVTHGRPVNFLRFYKKNLITASTYVKSNDFGPPINDIDLEMVKFWSLNKGKNLLTKFKSTKTGKEGCHYALSSKGHLLVYYPVSEIKSKLRLWKLPEKKLLNESVNFVGRLTESHVSNSGNFFISNGRGVIREFELPSLNFTNIYKLKDSSPEPMALSPDDRKIAFWDGSNVKIFDRKKKSIVNSFSPSIDRLMSIKFLNNKDLIITSRDLYKSVIYDLRRIDVKYRFEMKALDLNRQNKWILGIDQNKNHVLINYKNGKYLKKFDFGKANVELSGAGNLIAVAPTASGKGKVSIYKILQKNNSKK